MNIATPITLMALVAFIIVAIVTALDDSDPRDYVVATREQCWKLSGVQLSADDSGVSWHKEHGPTTYVKGAYQMREVLKGDFTSALNFLKVSNCAEE